MYNYIFTIIINKHYEKTVIDITFGRIPQHSNHSLNKLHTFSCEFRFGYKLHLFQYAHSINL